ncbi:MAG TPA: hypothetical protein VFC46_10030, partial [Humisphaera sp.]|nr:hypothetical protein [Humisphaera sp.]
LPPDVTSAVAESGPAAATSAASPNTASGANRQADDALHAVHLYIDNKLYAKAKIKLQEIISTYPASDAAKKAREMLAQLPDK